MEWAVRIWLFVCTEGVREVPTRAIEGVRMAVYEHTNGGRNARLGGLPSEEIIFGRSGAMISIRQKVQKVLGTDVPILIQGENGTGKGLLAQYIHSRSAMSSGAFVKVNCAAIPGALLESELFGYEKGSFTDAHASKPGYVEMAHRGTLFLDEIADLDLSLQAKVLQLLQDGHFSRIGDKQERRAETRIICATNRDLKAEIEAGRFRVVFFFQAEDGIRDLTVTGVQTCALPILPDDNLHAPNEKFHLPNFFRGIEAVGEYLAILGA